MNVLHNPVTTMEHVLTRLTRFGANVLGDLLESFVRQTLTIVVATHVEMVPLVKTSSLTSTASACLVLWESHVRLMLMTVLVCLAIMAALALTMSMVFPALASPVIQGFCVK